MHFQSPEISLVSLVGWVRPNRFIVGCLVLLIGLSCLPEAFAKASHRIDVGDSSA